MLSRGKESAAGIVLAVTVFTLAAGWPAKSQQPPAPEISAFRADSTLVLVPVTVVDRRGGIVNGLVRNEFTLTENGVRQQIRSFSEEDVSVSIGVVLDLSGSMKATLGPAKESLRALLRDANPADEAFLNAVSTRPRPFSTFTRNFDDLLNRIVFEKADGNTALFDTIYGSLKQLRSGIHNRKALLVISDGMDNQSRYSREELLRRAVESDAQVYTIAAGNAAAMFAKPIERTEEKRGLLFLDELAAKTGGMSFFVRGPTDVAGAAATIRRALRNQYTIGYAPGGNDRDGRWRRIRVKVADSGMKAYARSGYRLD